MQGRGFRVPWRGALHLLEVLAVDDAEFLGGGVSDSLRSAGADCRATGRRRQRLDGGPRYGFGRARSGTRIDDVEIKASRPEVRSKLRIPEDLRDRRTTPERRS